MNAVLKMPAMREAVRVPPHALEAEQGVIGGLMLAPDRIDTVAGVIEEADFYTPQHRAIWRAMVALTSRGQSIDAITLGEWFTANDLGHLVEDGAYLLDLANNTPSAINVENWARIVREKATLRRLIDQGTELTNSAWSADADATALLDAGIAGLMSMQRTETRCEYTLGQAMSLAYDEAEAAKKRGGGIPGIRTGLRGLDFALGGWHDGDLTIIAARPAMGKTALMLNHAVACPVACGIVSAEQPAQQIGARMMAIRSHVAAELMRTGRFEVDDLRRLENAVGELMDRTCLIYDRSAPSIADIARVARRWVQQSHARVIFVDYVQRIASHETSAKANRAEKVGEVVRGLKNLARDLRVPVIALAQVSRQAEGRQPTMADISDSSEIEKEADQVITLNRPGVYDASADPGLAVLALEKNRHGPTTKINVAWIPESMRFEDLAHD